MLQQLLYIAIARKSNLKNVQLTDEQSAQSLLRPTLQEDSLEIVPEIEESVVAADVQFVVSGARYEGGESCGGGTSRASHSKLGVWGHC